MFVQTFVNGMRNMQVRAALSQQCPTALEDSVAHALEVKTVRYEYNPHIIGKMLVQEKTKEINADELSRRPHLSNTIKQEAKNRASVKIIGPDTISDECSDEAMPWAQEKDSNLFLNDLE
ncbi:hypothetical protein EVAR_18503_1 [Eumeta japonica]|uniref:Uncharacterized protein n=1 Tax=Eumeta variegata TaxID=151549 RepID=A0A4C1V1L1_EUMVA|nr:hypothetical protein EVAR_18503_1 [Eumeta japonica]